MSDFLPAHPNSPALTIRDFVTTNDGTTSCRACKSEFNGKVERCDAHHTHLVLRLCTRIEGGAIIPTKDWNGRFTDVRVTKQSLSKFNFSEDKFKVGEILTADQFYEIVEIQVNSECGSRDLRWDRESLYNEQRMVLQIREDIAKDTLMIHQDNAHEIASLVERYRSIFSKDELISLFVAQSNYNAMAIGHLSNAVKALADRVIGAGNSLLGRY